MEGRRGEMASGTHNLNLHFLVFVIKQEVKSIQITLLNEEGIPDCSFFSPYPQEELCISVNHN